MCNGWFTPVKKIENMGNPPLSHLQITRRTNTGLVGLSSNHIYASSELLEIISYPRETVT